MKNKEFTLDKPLPRNLPSLTSCRLFAAISVVIYHFSLKIDGGAFDYFKEWGWLGVSFFFILSGFVLMWSHIPNEPKMHFYWRRLSRIYPLHIVCFMGSIMIYLISGHPFGGYVGTIPGTLANILLMQNWIPLHPEIRQSWNGVAWSLSSEWFFYLLAPFLFSKLLPGNLDRCFRGLTLFWCVLALVAFTIQNQTRFYWLSDIMQFHPVFGLMQFLAGAIAAQIVRRQDKLSWGILSSILFLFATFHSEYSHALLGILVTPFFTYSIMIVAKMDINQSKSFMRNKTLVLLGESSFALYMIHALMLGFIIKFLTIFFSNYLYSDWFFFVSMPLVLVVTIVASVFVHLRFELPIRNLLLRFSRKSPR